MERPREEKMKERTSRKNMRGREEREKEREKAEKREKETRSVVTVGDFVIVKPSPVASALITSHCLQPPSPSLYNTRPHLIDRSGLSRVIVVVKVCCFTSAPSESHSVPLALPLRSSLFATLTSSISTCLPLHNLSVLRYLTRGRAAARGFAAVQRPLGRILREKWQDGEFSNRPDLDRSRESRRPRRLP